MLRHAAAHARQASAQRSQWSVRWFAHSAPHASQICAQSWQMVRTKALSRAMHAAASRQMSAQSRSSLMQAAIAFTSFSPKQAVAQCSQAAAHALHARMHSSND
jgi:hypothetical protein